MTTATFIYLGFVFVALIFSFIGFILGCKYQEFQDALKNLPSRNVDNFPTPQPRILQDVANPQTNQDNIQIRKADVSKSRVMKLPSPEIIRKRRNEEALRSYEQDAIKRKRESGTYVL